METITYSLKGSQKNSHKHYKEIKSFTNEVLKEFKGFESSIILDLYLYI